MRHDHVTMFLDLMNYLNTNAKTLGGKNAKDLCYKAIERGVLKRSENTKKFVHFCDLRNSIAHGGANSATEITRDVIFEIYYIGLLILFLSSSVWSVKSNSGDIDIYHDGKFIMKFSAFMKAVEKRNQLQFITFER